MTKELIEEARNTGAFEPGTDYESAVYWRGLAQRIADALAASQPRVAKSEDDREALAAIVKQIIPDHAATFRSALVGELAEAGFSRAAVPDAATDELRAERDALGRAAFAAVLASGEDTDGATDWKSYFRPLRHPAWVDAVHQNVTSLAEERDEAQVDEFRERTRAEKAEAERDAALAAVERVRAIHVKDACEVECCNASSICQECGPGNGWPCPTVAALDGAPETEWEYRVEYQVPGGATHVSGPMDSLEEARGFELENIHGGTVVGRSKAVPAGPWEACSE